MPPAPANESVSLLSPFFTPSATAPLSERDCNNSIACPPVCKASAASCALRRGASFLDVDDACLALSDKTSFLIPEDSYLPGQENCAAPCAPASVQPLLGRSALSRPGHNASQSALAPGAVSSLGHHRQRLSTPLMMMEPLPPFGSLQVDEDGGYDEDGLFAPAHGKRDAASECFEKAVQELEMVEQRTSEHGIDNAAAGNMPGCLDPVVSSCLQPSQQQQQQQLELPPVSMQVPQPQMSLSLQKGPSVTGLPEAPMLPASYIPYGEQPVRRASSPSPSPAHAFACSGFCHPLHFPQMHPQPLQQHMAGLGAGAEQFLEPPQQPASAGPSVTENVADASLDTPSSSCANGVGMSHVSMLMGGWPAAGAPAAATGGGCDSNGAFSGADAAQAADAAADGVAPAAPAPRAFHHKTGGPCDHCGAMESPQWRRGPPAKPMLCNACGTRYRRTNQLNPAAAYTPAGRAAAAAAQQQQAASAAKQRGGKRESYGSTASAKRGRTSY